MEIFNIKDKGNNKEVSFVGSVLILPTLSIGNVGQITLDIILNTCSVIRVAYLNSSLVTPAVGAGALLSSPQGALFTSLELWKFETNNQENKSNEQTIYILQQRAPTLKNKNQQFANQLVDWIKESKFSKVILLSSVDSARQISSSDFSAFSEFKFLTKYYATDEIKELPKPELGWTSFDNDNFQTSFKSTSFVAAFIEKSQAQKLPLLLLSIICGGGLPIPHSIKMADTLIDYLKIDKLGRSDFLRLEHNQKGDEQKVQWIIPPWTYEISAVPKTIF